MPQLNLESTAYDPRIYSGMQFNKVIDAYVPPQCPATFDGVAQYFDASQDMCIPLNTNNFTSQHLAGSVTQACGADMYGGSPFMMSVGGECYSTNSCPTSSSLSEQCLNGQQIPVRENPLSGPGISCGGCYGGGPTSARNDKWRWV